ncbi:RimK family alpha-L-glutamate ligase [Chryseomicrobium palamuruense]|uniref:RimK family alpha-L-glutamate ligase n=1 Tax=Chryseomicrobium palamuruense TaxID=682973 RepID=A0ABV8UXG3_9BACL
MKGLLMYYAMDAEKNKSYIEWLVGEAKESGLELKLVVMEDLRTGFSLDDIDFVINRTREVSVSWQFELQGIRVFNSSEVTLLGNNKLAAYNYMQNRSVPFAKVLISPLKNKKTVRKPVSGHGGENVTYGIQVGPVDLANFVYQEHAGKIIGDVRFWIIGNEIHAAVLRSNPDSFLSNYSHGGHFEEYSYNTSQEAIVKRAIADLSIDYAGIDFFVTTDDQLLFNEIEDVVGSRMLSELGLNKTTTEWMRHIKKELLN